MSFTYDGVPLLAMLDEYAMLRHERQEEKRRMRASFNDVMITITDYFCSFVFLLITHELKKVLMMFCRTRKSTMNSKAQIRNLCLV